ncbi:hypothetical protein NDN08_008034 [Rhodosorus marinus]|uniref:phospholipase D n=1 Tax=Rhodosorus marinus TaxID=101924 RepID=A0AAV8V4A1_9RHOD|nr:hypothetical protein NDN08_008034 [Rhodosorus marinus]
MPVHLHGKLKIVLYGATSVGHRGSKAYATLSLAIRRVLKTDLMKIGLNGRVEWNVSMLIDVNDEVDTLDAFVKTVSRLGTKTSTVGMLFLNAHELARSGSLCGSHRMQADADDKLGSAGILKINVQYIPLRNLSFGMGVSDVYFPMRTGCKLSLFQDAHVHDKELPEILDRSEKPRLHRRAFEEMFGAMTLARKLIYIAGWSVYTELEMVRSGQKEAMQLGDFLVEKHRQGCCVVVLIWDDPTNNTALVDEGIMATSDEQTYSFFKGTGVQVAKMPRLDDGTNGFIGHMTVSGIFTHHQKIIVVDAPIPGRDDKRRILSYLGGLDLTSGRWDTPSHCLWSTLRTFHKNDFHQACLVTDQRTGPREPWHDVHCCLEGDAAWDVLQNFQDRCQCQGGKKLSLAAITEQEFIRRVDEQAVLQRDPDGWNAQIFRSIDERSAIFERGHNLITKKGRLLDASVQAAYVHHIRRAERFLYIENQYFIGSSHAWLSDPLKECTNLIPLEIVTKIVNMIKLRRDFRVYIVIPMFPEGAPESDAVQEILYWQYLTVEMMYIRIARELKVCGSSARPTDYLSFFCLGRREYPEDSKLVRRNSKAAGANHNRRFMIYLHSKMLIVDDEYIVLGSANINERSMSGTRDTEIAVGAYQPAYVSTTGAISPGGQVECFRKSLWAEHFGDGSVLLEKAETKICMEKIRFIGWRNWETYSSQEKGFVSGALLYPYEVSESGIVTPAAERFPDSRASIIGRRTMLPRLMTT